MTWRLYLGQLFLVPWRAARESDVVARLLLDAMATGELDGVNAQLLCDHAQDRQAYAVGRHDVVFE